MHSKTQRAGAPGALVLFIRLFVALALAAISVTFTSSSASAEPDPDQVVVCKYSHTPVTGELAQTIIIVSTNALQGEGFAGEFPFPFSDEQVSSIAIRFAEVGENANDLEIGECPPFPGTDECPELPGDQPEGFQCEPLTETDTRVLTDVDCESDTVTIRHQERTRTQEFVNGEWVWGPWSAWVTVSTEVVDATEDQCPGPVNPPPPPPPNPPNPTAPPAPPTPTLPNTGLGDNLGALALLGGLVLAASAGLIRRSRRIGLPTS